MRFDKKDCWIISDNIIGHENQSIALADKLNLKYLIKKIKRLNYFQRNLLNLFPSLFLERNLYPPYPKIIISCGRNTAYVAEFFKRKLKKKILSIFIQKPPINNKFFDLIITPKHDQYRGKNVINTNGSLTRIDQKYIRKIKQKIKKPSFIKEKYIVLLIGGNSRHHKIDNKILIKMKDNLKKVSEKYNFKILILFSRRTGEFIENYLKDNLNKKKFIFIPNNSKKVDYLIALSYAEIVIVSSDSVSMVSDACSTGKPVYLIDIPTKSKKFKLFINNLINLKLVKFFNGSVSLKKNKNTLNDTENVANNINIKILKFLNDQKI